jgi:predicted Rossmann-fold nucleotide-binding protein
LHHFVLTSDAYVVSPGGIGTVLELMLIWQLLQVKHVHDTPLILVGKMWPDLVGWAGTHLLGAQPPLVNAEDLAIPRCVNTGDEAIALLREHFNNWRST